MSDTVAVRPMVTRRDMREFHLFPWRIYRDDPVWVPPLVPERMKITDPSHGGFFRRGEAAFFGAYRSKTLVGTICVARDDEQIATIGRPECIFGFFESIDDRSVAAALFSHADSWARERGLESLHGPFNLDYEDGYGILTDGGDREPVLFCGHTPPYYVGLLRSLGFEPARAGNIALAIDLDRRSDRLEHIGRLADRVRAKGRFRVRSADVGRWQDEARRVHYLLNHSLHETGEPAVPWPMDAVEGLIRPVLRIADPDLVLFAERVDGPADIPRGPDGWVTVGWFAGIPNMNEITRHLKGLRRIWHYAILPFAMLRRPKCLAVKSLLVLPEYHTTGVAALLFDEMARRSRAKGYEWLDLSLTSEGNPQTPRIAERAGAVRYKRYQVYRRSTGL
jgi:GNAT superfamily N-acetyltransferase